MNVQGRWITGLGVAVVVACGGRANKSPSDEGDLGGASGDLQGPDESGGAAHAGGAPSTGGGWTVGAGGLNFRDGSGGFTMTSQHCPSGTYDPDLDDGVLECEPWTACEAGSYIETWADHAHDHVCVSCEEGFTEEDNARSCQEWTRCRYSQIEETPPTSSSDRVCARKEGYVPYAPYGYPFDSNYYDGLYRSGPLLVTDQGTHQLIGDTGNYASYPQYSSILRYSPTGALKVLAENIQVTDLAALSQDLLLVGWNTIHDDTKFSELGYMQRRTSAGAIVWQSALSSDEVDHWTHAQVSVTDDEVLVVSRVVERVCEYDTSAGNFICDEEADVPNMILHVYDSQGQAQETTLLQEDTDVAGILDMQVASDGHIYVAVTRELEISEHCAALDPNSMEYSQSCRDTYETAILEYDAAGDLQADHAVGVLSRPSAKLVPTDDGSVYAFSRAQYDIAGHLFLLGPGGDVLFDKDLPNWVTAFTTTADGLFFVGPDLDTGEQVFAEASPAIELGQITRESDYAPFDVEDAVVGPNGTIMLASRYNTGTTSSTGSFVRPWPE